MNQITGALERYAVYHDWGAKVFRKTSSGVTAFGLALGVLVSAGQAEAVELIDARMDQITAGGVFELTADELRMVPSTPVAPLQHNVIGGVGVLFEQLLSDVFRSRESLLQDIAMSVSHGSEINVPTGGANNTGGINTATGPPIGTPANTPVGGIPPPIGTPDNTPVGGIPPPIVIIINNQHFDRPLDRPPL